MALLYNRTPIATAVRSGNYDQVRELLEHEIPHALLMECFMYAVYHRKVNIIELMFNNPRVDVSDRISEALAHITTYDCRGHIEILGLLLSHSSANVAYKDYNLLYNVTYLSCNDTMRRMVLDHPTQRKYTSSASVAVRQTLQFKQELLAR
jgi:hypothetical protein